ncbi:NAD(P)H-binding protein [Acinetobacter portensis]|uniref:NAD(P)H-binding protein n=1 Tax=Acinetobacter portensis TaxID=1839785 RepID=UPI0013D4DCFD|nr:NAD(P)H-binding protein [Acinetobacter portensis]
MHILFIGYGKTSQRVAKQLFALDHQITTISSSPKTDEYATHLIQDIHRLNLSQISPIDCVYILLSPKQSNVDGYREAYLNSAQLIISALKDHPIKRIIVVSSTRVYGENAGQGVDDESPINPCDEQGQILAEMEQVYLKAFSEKCTIIRPTGIYDGLSKRMIGLAENTKTYPNIHWSNRIHVNDLASFLAHVLHVEHLKQSYIVTNNKPEPLHEKILKIQKELNLLELVLESTKETGKRIFATRMLDAGFQLKHD